MDKPIKNINDLTYEGFSGSIPEPANKKFGGTIGQIGFAMGFKKLGANVTKVPPGMRVFPFHNHRINEEFFLILEGEGTLRFGTEEYAIKKGDVIFCPTGGPEVAHQIVNTGDTEMQYLAVSSRYWPEICDYPNTGKFGVLDENFRFLGHAKDSLGYWDGEG